MMMRRTLSFGHAASLAASALIAALFAAIMLMGAPASAQAAEQEGGLAAATVQIPNGSQQATQTATQPAQAKNVSVYALHNAKSGDRIYTASAADRDKYRRQGWVYDGVGWTAPAVSANPVYAMYRAGYGHYYTNSKADYDKRLRQRWTGQGIAFYMPNADQPRIALYRDYNPKSKKTNYLITKSRTAHNAMVKKGWKSKGLWYAVPTAGQLRNGWVNQGGAWHYYKNGTMYKSRWLVTSSKAPITTASGKQRYWFDSKGNLARNRLISPAKAVDKKAGRYAYARSGGNIVVGRWDNGKGRVYVTDKAGRLPSKGGWLVTKKYDGHLERYYIDSKTHAAKSGCFTVKGKRYWGVAKKGYVLRNSTVQYKNAWYTTNNSGRMTKDAQVTRLARKVQGYASDTRYLIAIDIDNPRFILFTGKKGAWKIRNVWECDTGRPSTPTIQGVYKMGIKGYSFGHGYTCYYYSQILGDYLIHTRIYQEGTWILNDGPLGRRCSDGCVRLATENAHWVWRNVPSGTTIITTT